VFDGGHGRTGSISAPSAGSRTNMVDTVTTVADGPPI